MKNFSKHGVKSAQTLNKTSRQLKRLYVSKDSPVNEMETEDADKEQLTVVTNVQLVQSSENFQIMPENETYTELLEIYKNGDISQEGITWSNLNSITTDISRSPETLTFEGVQTSNLTSSNINSIYSNLTTSDFFVITGIVSVAVTSLKNDLSSASGGNTETGESLGSNETSNLISGAIYAGPVTGGLSVSVYDAHGKVLGSGIVSEDGHFNVYIGDYIGPVYVRVIDSNGIESNYYSEMGNIATDLAVTLLAVANVSLGTNSMYITPLTTLAAHRVGVPDEGSGPLNPLTHDAVYDANFAVARAFGLNEVDIIKLKPITTLEDGTNHYGKILAALEGASANDQEILNSFATGIQLSRGFESPAKEPETAGYENSCIHRLCAAKRHQSPA